MYRHASERLKPRHLSRRGFGEFGTAVTTTDSISNGMAMRARTLDPTIDPSSASLSARARRPEGVLKLRGSESAAT